VETQAARAQHYIDTFDAIIKEDWLLGWHWCGYIENLNRGWGMKDPRDEIYQDYVLPIAEYNRNVYDKI
jgi:hypothetical protein